MQAAGFLPLLPGGFSASDAFVRGCEPSPQRAGGLSEPPARTMTKGSECQCSSSKGRALARFACCSCLSLSQGCSLAFCWRSSTKPAGPVRHLMEGVWGWLTRILDHQNPPISRQCVSTWDNQCPHKKQDSVDCYALHLWGNRTSTKRSIRKYDPNI